MSFFFVVCMVVGKGWIVHATVVGSSRKGASPDFGGP